MSSSPRRIARATSPARYCPSLVATDTRRRLAQRLAKKHGQPSPVTFGACLVVDAVVRHRPAMLHADIVLDDVVDFGRPERLGQTCRLLRREAAVDPGRADIDTRLDA